MIYKELIQDYLSQNKALIAFFIIVTLLTFPIETIVIPEFYSKLYVAIGNKKTTDNIKRVGRIIVIIIGIWLIIQGFYFLKNWMLSKILPKYLEFTRKKLFVKIIENYENNYKDIKVGKNVSRIFELTRELKDLFYYLAAVLLPLIMTTLIVVIYFFFIDWKIGIAALCSLFVFFLVNVLLGIKIVKLSSYREGVYLNMTESVYDSFDNLMNVYLNNEKTNEISKTQKIQDLHTSLYKKQLNLVSNMEISSSIISIIIFALIIGIAFYNYKKGIFANKKFITVSLITIYFMGFLINMSGWTPPELLRTGVLKQSEPFLKSILNKEKTSYIKNPNINGNIKFDKITYSYGQGTIPIFSNFSFLVKKGEKVAILGPSGSGKTTLMKILLGLHKVQKGSVLINNININKINPEFLREKVNYINQRTGLFNGTVLDNMKYGNKISNKKLVALLKKYELDVNFSRLKKGVYSNVGVQGREVSGGMQKIIMNVRGILKTGNIIVFDEPLAGLDANTRIKMIKLIKDLSKDKTLIVITHDKEILEIMDKTVNLKKIQDSES